MLGIVSINPQITRTLTVDPKGGAVLRPFRGRGGIAPNDFELARQYSWYTPVDHGWVIGQKQSFPQGALGSAAVAAAAATIAGHGEDTSDMLRKLVGAETLKSRMAVVSASAVVLMTIIGVATYMRKRGE